VLGTDRTAGPRGISVGLWTYSDDQRAALLSRAGVTSDQSEAWFAADLGWTEPARLAG
jgi:hypothetical protein